MSSSVSTTSGQLITELTNGANLVDGKATWEYAQSGRNDLDYMKKCCGAELRQMEIAGLVAAPFYIERVAVLSRKGKNYRQEVDYCETYIRVVERYYQKHGTEGIADIRKGPTYQAIVKRLPKARELLARSSGFP